MDKELLSIDDIGLSFRSTNALHRYKIHTVGEMLDLTDEDIIRMRNVGQKSASEITAKIREYTLLPDDISESNDSILEGTIDPIEHYDEWLSDKNNQAKVISYLQKAEIKTDALSDLPAKAYNCLAFAGYTELHRIIFMGSRELMCIPRMDSNTAMEIRASCRYYLRNNKSEILKGVEIKRDKVVGVSNKQLSFTEIIHLPENKDAVLNYVKLNDVSLSAMNLSVRTGRCLSQKGYKYLSDIIFKSKDEFSLIENMGRTSIDEITGKVSDYLNKHEKNILAYINGDTSVLIDDNAIRNSILKIYQSLGFRGLHLPEITEKLGLPESVSEDTVKRIIGGLIAEGELEYVDFMVYRVYPSYISYLNKCDSGDNREARCMRLKLQGETLESIAQKEGITRERVRQIIQKQDRRLHNRYLAETGLRSWFDEDYYRHLFTNYAIHRKTCIEWLGISLETYNYLDMSNEKGKKNLYEALDDSELDVGLKLKIKNYLNRDKIFIDGCWIEKSRSNLEDYVLMKFCKDEITFNDFVEVYNGFLKSQGIPFSDKLYYTDEVIRTRSNKLTDSRNVLWKQFQRLRYYNIDSRDYSELLETLNLDAYENIELSTLKFFEDYPELMARYDIRDQYELHNLLKKIIPDGSYHDMHFGRMPSISFGEFNFTDALMELLLNNAPISQKDLIELVHAEYGFDKTTLAASTYFRDINEYYHMGMYTIDSKIMPASHEELLQSALREDFYYIDEIKHIYTELVPDADLEAINPYNLKAMGFTVREKYVLKNWPSADAYFRSLLLSNEVVDLAPLKKRFWYIHTTWSATLTDLRSDYEILEFEPDKIINIKKLEKNGITKEMLKEYCDDVYNYLEKGTYFTVKSLNISGFYSPLYDLGFSDWFYANLLYTDSRFSYSKMLGEIVLYKGKEDISIRTFLIDQIKQAGKIDIIDLMNDLNDDFGCSVNSKFEITQRIQDSEIFYDPILERLYANAELYYKELDEDMEGV